MKKLDYLGLTIALAVTILLILFCFIFPGCDTYRSSRRLCVFPGNNLGLPTLEVVVENNTDKYLSGYVTCHDKNNFNNFKTKNIDIPPQETAWYRMDWPWINGYVCEIRDWRP